MDFDESSASTSRHSEVVSDCLISKLKAPSMGLDEYHASTSRNNEAISVFGY